MLLITTTARREEFAQEAYEQGCDQTEAEYAEALEDKSVFIEKQAGIIVDLMTVLDGLQAWDQVPEELRNQLADYV